MARFLNDWLTGYLAYTYNTEPADQFKLWTGVSVIASVLQRKCFILWDRDPIYPQLYIILIGPTSTRKTTALNSGKAFLLDPTLSVHLSVDSTSRASFIRDIKNSQEIYTTTEGSLQVHSSITVLSKELTVFLGFRNTDLLGDLTDWYDSVDTVWIHKTIQGNAQEIPSVWVNLLGATTPDLLRASLPQEAIGGGLTARMLFIYAEKRGKKAPSNLESEEEITLRQLLSNDLQIISSLGGQFKISSECMDFYNSWYLEYDEEEACKDARFLGYFNRKPTTLRKLGMILSASRNDSKIIELCDLQLGLNMLERVESTMYWALQGIGRNEIADITHKVMLEIARLKDCSIAHLMWRFKDDLTKFELDKVFGSLESMKFCYINPGTGSVKLNPKFDKGA